MGRFKKKGKNEVQAISTASLPDIVFMLLFFFMVTTVMKEDDPMVRVSPPKANQISKLEDKSLVSYINIGKPKDEGALGTLPRIQLNDALEEPEDIRQFIASEREKLDENEKNKMMVSLKIDKEVEMGIVIDVKMALRRAQALKINYSTVKGDPIKGMN